MSVKNEIRGNTLKIYIYLLRHGHSELRAIQHGVGLSSPSLASYHLGKLLEAGFVKQDEYGRYFALKEASEKVLEGFSRIGPAIVPQLFYFALLFTIIVPFFSILALQEPASVPYLVAVCAAMVIVLWYETLRVWRRLSA